MMPMKFFARLLPLLLFFSASAPLPAQRRFPGTPELEQRLNKLNELGTVLMIAAHPDDERTSVLAYFARGRHMRTAYLSLTRGEGGQNLIGSELGAQLGLIRTHELLAAREIDGAEQFFTRAIDFGFTKTASETLEKWGHDRILSDVVWVIRSYRPDVVIQVFSGTPRDGHGQHQVSAILAKEAFEASGDATRFPEQLKLVRPWKAKRLVQAAFPAGLLPPPPPGTPARGGRGTPAQGVDAVKSGSAETGAFNPILGYSYEELAVLSRSMHYSQGTGAMRRPGPAVTEFNLVAGEPATKDLFDDIDTTWNRLPGGAAVGPLLAEAIRAFEPAHPERAVPALVKARPLIAAIDDPLARIKLAEIDEALAACAGLFVEAQANRPEAVTGGGFAVTTTVLNRSSVPVSLEKARIEGVWNEDLAAKPATLGYNQSTRLEFSREIPASQPLTQPYWLVKPAAGDVYVVDDQRLIGLPDNPAPAQVRVFLKVGGASAELVRPVHFRYADRASGERVRPLAIVPPVAVNLPTRVVVFPSSSSRTIHVSVRANLPDVAGELRLQAPQGWKSEPGALPFRISTQGEQQELAFTVTPPQGETIAELRAVANVSGREITAGMQTVAYSHIPTQLLFPSSTTKLVRSDIRVTARHVGYIMGAGDEMPEALRQLGLDVTLLSPSDIEQGDLSRFDTIVAGVRVYNVRSDVRANHPRLMEYVRNGGTYVVQYVTGDDGLSLGPYPMTVPPGTRYRVTVEEAPVVFPHEDSPLLQTPNRITPRDFEGWVQERGLYFSTKWDPRYQTVLSSHDPGEDGMEGGELWARYGKGVYIFSSYAWFRQLPAGVPGAYRLFANMLSAK